MGQSNIHTLYIPLFLSSLGMSEHGMGVGEGRPLSRLCGNRAGIRGSVLFSNRETVFLKSNLIHITQNKLIFLNEERMKRNQQSIFLFNVYNNPKIPNYVK